MDVQDDDTSNTTLHHAVLEFPMSTDSSINVSDRTLDETPARVITFLAAISLVPEIRAALANVGMTEADLEEGRQILVDLVATPCSPKPALDTTTSEEQRQALMEVDQWDESAFARTYAVLNRYYPAACAYLFQNLQASRGPDSVRGVLTYTARLNILESGSDPDRQATRNDDKKAVALLAHRGIDQAERARITELAMKAIGPTESPLMPEASPNEEKRRQTLINLRRWFEDWSETARAVVRKRQHIIRLGLGKRREPKSKTTVPAPATSSS